MQLSPLVQAHVLEDPPLGPTTPKQAADELSALPARFEQSVLFTALDRMSGMHLSSSRAELVAPFLAETTPQQARMTLLNAIHGAIGVAPDLEQHSQALSGAAAGFEALLTAASTSHAREATADAWNGILTDYLKVIEPVVSAVEHLDSIDRASRTPGAA